MHAAFDGRRVALWGETRRDLPAAEVVRRRQPIGLQTSPYDPGDAALLLAVGSSGVSIASCRAKPAAIWMPSLDDRPVASDGLVAELPDGRHQVAIRPWKVTALTLDWPSTIEFLCACMNRRSIAPNVIVGDDLAYWSSALRFAGALVARQHFLPDVAEEDGMLLACWRPVPSHDESRALAQLAAAMPDACRSLTTDKAPPGAAPANLLSDFLRRAVDHLARLPTAAPTSRPSLNRERRATESFDSVDAQWLAALRGSDARLEVDRVAFERLKQRAQDWWRPIAANAASPFRLCFRLEEPQTVGADTVDSDTSTAVTAADAGPLRLRYLLQAHHDQSLMVPASEAWSARGRKAAPFKSDGFNVREFLLQSLGQAARICSPIEDSLRGGIPDSHEIDAPGAVTFLTEQAGLLEQAGFGIILPATWTSKGTKLRLSARAKVKSPAMQAASGLSLADLVDFDWEVALGDHTLSRKELVELARLKTPLVRMRGQWVLLNADEIRQAIALLHRKAGKISAREVVRMALGGTAVESLGAGSVAIEGWLGELITRLKEGRKIEELAPPAGFNGTLRPYQLRGYSWLSFLCRWGLGACLADDMGLGKTIQTLAHIQRDRRESAGRPILLVCPTSVIGNWQHEAARFTPDLSVMVYHGVARAKGETFRKTAEEHDIVFTSYSLLQRDFETLNKAAWSGIVLDEAQNIKNPEAKQARAARTLKSDYRIALTGTPVENNVGDLWSLMEFLNPGFLGSQAEFKRSFFIPIQAVRDSAAAERLKSLTAPFILRRLKTDRTIIADLPEKLEMKVYCTLTQEQASLYAAVVEEAMAALEAADGIQRKGIVLATLSKLKQVCNHPAQFLGDNSAIAGRSGKLARLTEMLEEVLETNERALIFSQFSAMGEIIRRHLEATFGREVAFLHGAVPKVKRDRMVAHFQQPDGQGPALFVLSLKAGGTGLNLTAANHVFHFDRWWNPAVENQATDRAFRIGQRRNVLVHKFLCAGTLEDKIDAIIEQKKSTAEAVVSSGEEWLTKLSTNELRDLFALRAEATAQ